jgi:chromosome segregation ATPase
MSWWNEKGKLKKHLNSLKNSIRMDMYDHEAFERASSNNRLIKQTIKDNDKEFPFFKDLTEDAFASLYKYHPEIVKDFEIKNDRMLNREVIKQIRDTQKYKELRSVTKMDELHATIGTEALSEELVELLKKSKEQVEAQKAMQKAAQELKDAESGAKEGDEEREALESNSISIEEAKKKLEEAKKNFKDSIEDKKFKENVSRMVGKAQSSVEEMANTIRNWDLIQILTIQNFLTKKKWIYLKD